MIRSYRTSRNCTDLMILIIDLVLSAIDRTLDVIAHPVVLRLLRGVTAIACIIGFVFVIGAIEHHTLALFPALVISGALVLLEIVCLRGNS